MLQFFLKHGAINLMTAELHQMRVKKLRIQQNKSTMPKPRDQMQ
jgi:hypothetical protein